MSKRCPQCNYTFSMVARQFYCCNKKEPVCITCRKKKCQKCNNPRNNQVTNPRCLKCYAPSSAVDNQDMFYEFNCDNYFCSKCVLHAPKKGDFRVLPCSHTCTEDQWKKFLQNCCVKCGSIYQYTIDYELIDLRKVCFRCFRLFKSEFQSLLIKCMVCERSINNYASSGNATQDFIVCRFCCHQNELEQGILQKSKIINSHQKPEERPLEKPFFQDPSSEQQKSNEKQDKNKVQIKLNGQARKRYPKVQPTLLTKISEKTQQSKIQSIIKQNQIDKNIPETLSDINEVNIKKIKSDQTLNQQLKSSNLQILSTKHSQQIKNPEKTKNQTQVSRDYQQNQLIDELSLKQSRQAVNNLDYSQQIIPQQNLSPLKLKKHNSIETYLENIKLQIQQKKQQQNLISCQLCNYLVPSVLTFQLEGNRVCRLCYLMKNTNNTYLGFSKSNEIDLTASRSRPLSNKKYTNNITRPQSILGTPNRKEIYNTLNELNLNKYDVKINQDDKFDKYRQSHHIKMKASDVIPQRRGQALMTCCALCQQKSRSFYYAAGKGNLCANCYNKQKYSIK